PVYSYRHSRLPLLSCARSRPPPRSPLFPYTTLFRSWRSDPHAERPALPGRPPQALQPHHRAGEHRGRRPLLHPEPAVVLGQLRRDRKSTRLNSSHVKISYAVFCLKKKKKNEDLICEL